MRLLILRPQPDAARTASALRGRGHEPVIAPLVEIAALAQVDPGAGPWAALLLTSANALCGLTGDTAGGTLRAIPVFTVGERTAQAIRQNGFTTVASADGNAADLANLVATRLQPPAPLLYLAGEDRSGDLADDLRGRGFAVETIVVYRAMPAEKLPQAVTEALVRGIDGVLHYSRRSAQAYVEAARGSGMLARALSPAHFCLSGRIAEPLAGAGAATLKVASRPSEAALLDLIGEDAS